MALPRPKTRTGRRVASIAVAVLALAGSGAIASASSLPLRESPTSHRAGPSSTGNSFEAVTCASAGNCVAVGQLGVHNGGRALIDVESAGAWTFANAPSPGDASAASPNDELSAVSCPSPSSCVAVGYYANHFAGSTYQQALIELETAGSWAAMSPPLPADASPTPQNTLDAVSCPSVGECAAVGSYVDTAGNPEALLDVETHGTWSSVPVPLPVNADRLHADNSLDAVTCTSSGSCVAVGSYVDTTSTSTCPNKDCLQALVDVATSGAWTTVNVPLPPDATASPLNGNALAAVTCTATSSCVAVGSYVNTGQNTKPLLDVETSGTWAAVAAPLPGDASTSPNTDALTSVSCVSGGNCVAVGQYDNAAENPQGLIDTESGGSWTSTTAPVPSDGNLALPDVLLTSVSCSTLSNCVAVGSYEIPPIRNLSPNALLDAEVNGVWTAGTVDLPRDASTAQPYSTMNQATCVTPWSCVAVGLYVDAGGDDQVILDALGVALTPLPVVPSPPNTVVATVGHGQASVGWIAPAGDGGSPITSYTVTASPGGASCSTTGATRCRVWPMSGATTYTFSVEATNMVGASPPSTSSPPVRTLPVVDATATIGSFAAGSSQLSHELRSQIILLAKAVVLNGDARIAVVGYSDTSGSAAQSKAVSLHRADVVAAALRLYLSNLHVSGMTISIAGRGSADPIASNMTPGGRAKNRRVVASLS